MDDELSEMYDIKFGLEKSFIMVCYFVFFLNYCIKVLRLCKL